MSRLEVRQLTKRFGGIMAVNGVNLTVESGGRHAIIGPNGAGKSTLFNLIAGEHTATSGRVLLDGRDVTKLAVNERANLGLGHTFQRNNLFLGLTTFENVRLAVQHRQHVNRHILTPIDQFAALKKATADLLHHTGLYEQRNVAASTLAYGQQRALEIALALATEPTVLLLDEPTAGMSPAETLEMTKLIESLPRTLTMLIVEHDMDVIFSLADTITVLHYGQVITSGAPEEVRRDAQVQEIYLGVG